MNYKQVKQMVRGVNTQDGAGVKLTRVLHRDTVEAFDPFLMLDSFDSENYEDFKRGFPQHPHRGIETISILKRGAMTHKDSIGNEDTITDNQVQWMTAGSGILHEEMLPQVEKMLGLQLWFNMSRDDKMKNPHYQALKEKDIKTMPMDYGQLRVIVGDHEELSAYQSEHHPLKILEFTMKAGTEVDVKVDMETSFIFTLLGDVKVGETKIKEKTAALFGEGDVVKIQALSDAVILYFESVPHREPIAWGGPIVMNTDEELRQAFNELRQGTFIKKEANY